MAFSSITVAPGHFDTERVRSLDNGRAARAGITVEEPVAQPVKEIALLSYGTPEGFARYVMFLGFPANNT